MYRYISRESCSQFDSLPLTSLTIQCSSLRRSLPPFVASPFVVAHVVFSFSLVFFFFFFFCAQALYSSITLVAGIVFRAISDGDALVAHVFAPSPGWSARSFIPLLCNSAGGIVVGFVVKVSVLLFTVTFHANHAHNLTRSP